MSTGRTDEELAGEAYQIIAAIAGTNDELWNNPDVQAALTYFSRDWRRTDVEAPLMHGLPAKDEASLARASNDAKQIWKFDLRHGAQHITAPGLGQAVFFARQDDCLRVWCEVRPGQPEHTFIMDVIGTGHQVPRDARHVGSIQDGPFVWHLFQAASC